MAAETPVPRKAARAFLDAHGWQGIQPTLLAGDASFRKYFRLRDGKREAVLMDAPPPQEDVRPFVTVATHLYRLGLSAPRVDAAEPHAGFLLLEDLGDDTFTRALNAGGSEADLYARAVDALLALHAHPAPNPCRLPGLRRRHARPRSRVAGRLVPARMGRQRNRPRYSRRLFRGVASGLSAGACRRLDVGLARLSCRQSRQPRSAGDTRLRPARFPGCVDRARRL